MNMLYHSNYLSLLSLELFYDFQCTNLSLPKEPFPLSCLGPLESGMEDGLMKRMNVSPSPLYLLSGYL